MDPAQSGVGGCIADIGTHAFNFAIFVTGLVPLALLADLTAFGPGRVLDDNAAILLRFEGGAKGMIWASQVAPGTKNALRLRVVGEGGGLMWDQERPDDLEFTPLGQPTRTLRRGGEGGGHPFAFAGWPSRGLSLGLCHALRRGRRNAAPLSRQGRTG
jgi:predicted dehydrogenase